MNKEKLKKLAEILKKYDEIKKNGWELSLEQESLLFILEAFLES